MHITLLIDINGYTGIDAGRIGEHNRCAAETQQYNSYNAQE
jgi:hypothetical protein